MQAMKASAENLMANLALGEDISQPLQMLTESISAFLFNNLLPMVGNILAQVPQLIVGAISNVGQFADELVFSGVDLVTQLVTGIITSIPQIITAAGQLASNLWNAITSVDWVGVGTEIMNSFNGGVALDIPQIVATGSQMIASFIANIASHLPEFLQKGMEIIGQLVAGLIGAIPDIVGAIPGIVSAAAEGFTGFDWGGIGSQIVNGVVSGIKAMGSAIADALMGLAKSAWDGLKDFFGIASPSTLMRDTIGQYIPLGVAEGINETSKYVTKAMDNMAMDAMAVNITPTTGGTVASRPTAGNISVAVNVYGNVEDYDALANRIADTINEQLLNKMGALA
jgi:phage-related protein